MSIEEMANKLLEKNGNLMFFFEAIKNDVIDIFPNKKGNPCVVYLETLDAIQEDGSIVKAWEICDCFEEPKREENKEVMKYEVEWKPVSNVLNRDGFLSWMFDFAMESHHGQLDNMFEAIKEFDYFSEKSEYDNLYFCVSEDEIVVNTTIDEDDMERCCECDYGYIIIKVDYVDGNYIISRMLVTKKKRHFREITVTAELLLREDYHFLVEVDENGNIKGDVDSYLRKFKNNIGKQLLWDCDYTDQVEFSKTEIDETDIDEDAVYSDEYFNSDDIFTWIE